MQHLRCFLLLLFCLWIWDSKAVSQTKSDRSSNVTELHLDANNEMRFESFWPKFRKAALDGNLKEIKSITNFPFKEIAGASPTNHLHDEASFTKLFPKLLDQDSGAGGSLPMRKFIGNRSFSVPGDVAENGKRARIGTFEFEMTKQGWRFSEVYSPK